MKSEREIVGDLIDSLFEDNSTIQEIISDLKDAPRNNPEMRKLNLPICNKSIFDSVADSIRKGIYVNISGQIYDHFKEKEVKNIE